MTSVIDAKKITAWGESGFPARFLVPYRHNKHVLFGQQEGRCNGPRNEFPFRVLEVDHIIPRGGGGQDNIENLQLLCATAIA